MALGKPIVQYELFENKRSAGESALYAEPNDIKDLATKIEILLADPALRTRLGKLGRKRMEDALEWKYQAPVLLEAYAHTFSEKSKTLRRARLL